MKLSALDPCSESACPSPATAAVCFQNVSKTYRSGWLFGQGRATAALRDVTFSVGRGETIGLLGPNGAGKTTALKIMTTLVWPTGGRVRIHDVDIRRRPVEARRSIGLVTCDERSFYWRLTAVQNLRFFATLYGVPAGGVRRRIDELLEALGLADAADRPYQTFSAGMKQKLAIARGLLANPSVVLYDEPTRSLDPLSTYNIRQWIIRNRLSHPHQTHVIATHQLTEAEQLCDRVLILNKGVIAAEGSVDEIRRKYRLEQYDIHRIAYRAETQIGLMSSKETGVVSVEQERGHNDEITVRLTTERHSPALTFVLDRIIRSRAQIVRCETERPTFDDIFCSVILRGEQTGYDHRSEGGS